MQLLRSSIRRWRKALVGTQHVDFFLHAQMAVHMYWKQLQVSNKSNQLVIETACLLWEA